MSVDNLYLDKYIEQMTDILIKTNKNLDKNKVKVIVTKTVLDRLKDPDVTLDNNYTHETKKTKLTSVFHWAMKTKPIIAGNGTFYKQHKDARNPNVEMVDGFLETRDKLKKEMFSIDDEESFAYRDLDLKQGNKKKLANSFYGGSGAKTSAFYSKYSGPASTLSAQSVISSTETMFEAFIADNFIFIDFNECFTWINHVLKEDFSLDEWVEKITLDECCDRIFGKVLDGDEKKYDILRKYLSHLREDEWTHLYYKNNLIEFTSRHEKIKDLHDTIFSSINSSYKEIPLDKKGNIIHEEDISFIPKDLRDEFMNKKNPAKEWNKYVSIQKFYDPNKIPDTIEKELEELSNIYMKYCYVQFLPLDKIYRLRNFRRDVVTVIDTDSNILSLDTWMNFCKKDLMRSDYNRSEFDNVFIAINTITYVLTQAVTDILLYYGKCSNVAKEHRVKYKMKNEFFFSKLVIAKTKKRYLSKILLREGNRLTKPKYDIKGFDLKKSTTSEEAEKFYMEIIKNYIMEPKHPMLNEMIQALNGFKKEIRDSIQSGDRKYLPNANAKELEAYKDPSTSQGVRGVLAWNMCEPERIIEFPAKVSLLKMNLETEEELEPLKEKYPEIYQRIKEGIFEDKSGIFIKKVKDKDGGSKLKKVGMKVLAIPTNDRIPEWAIDYIDYTTIINNILGPFNSVKEIFNLPTLEEGRTGRKSQGLTNIIKL